MYESQVSNTFNAGPAKRGVKIVQRHTEIAGQFIPVYLLVDGDGEPVGTATYFNFASARDALLHPNGV